MDVTLLFLADTTTADIALDAPGLLTGDELQSGITISIFTDARANDDDLVELADDKRGWFADSFNPIRNDKIGSRLWLLRRAKLTNETIVKAREYVLEATRWLIDDSVASTVNVVCEKTNNSTLGIQVVVQKPSGSQTFNFSYAWNQI